jgi:hypothetical protein
MSGSLRSPRSCGNVGGVPFPGAVPMRTSLALAAALALAGTLSCAVGDDEAGGSGGSAGSGAAGGSGGLASHGPYTLSVSGVGYTSHGGLVLRAALVDLTQQKVVARLVPPADISLDGAFSFELGDVLEQGVPYRLDYFAEHLGEGIADTCDPADHRWSTAIAPVKGDVTLALTHNYNFSDVVCASFAEDPGPFDLSFFGTNYTSHVGENVYVKLVEVETDEVVKTLDPIVVSQDATWSFVMKDVLQKGVDYKLVYFADHNMPGNGTCERPADHVWSLLITNPVDDVTEHIEHLAQFDEDACRYFAP